MENRTMSEPKLSLLERILKSVSALQYRNYRLYFFGLLISVTGFQMLLVIQGWLVWDITGDPSSLAFLGGVTAAPTVILNLFGGVVADQFNQRYLIMFVQGAIGLLLAALATLVYLDTAGLLQLELWHILLLSFLIAGTTFSIYSFNELTLETLLIYALNKDIIVLDIVTTKVSAKVITSACSTFTVTARAEQIPRTCLVIGLLSISGSINVFLLFIFYFL